jgi:hypothetical protein
MAKPYTIFSNNIFRRVGLGIEPGNQVAILSIGDEKNCQ